MTRRLILGMMLSCALAVQAAAQTSAPASPQQSAVPSPTVTFVGQSRATVPLKRDVVAMISAYSQARHSCRIITKIESTPLAQTYEPKTAMFRATAPGHFYERWNVDLCGTKRPFLVGMWPSPKGGTDFQVAEVPAGTEP